MNGLQDDVMVRLTATGTANASWALIILAALEGDATLQSFLDGTTNVSAPSTSPQQRPATPATEPPGVFLSSIAVSGFRGIGPAATLKLKPGPGLTLVVGRNGSGKSSFAEALEYLFTGTSYRWDGRPAPWKSGWKNLHDSTKVSLRADLLVEGQGPLTISRVWRGDALADADTLVAKNGAKDKPLSSLGWDQALDTFRPFLSYNELGSLLDEGPSKLYDALSSVLGLDQLTAVLNSLTAARKTREQLVTTATNTAQEIVRRIAAVQSDDDRFSRALAAFGEKPWNLAALQKLVIADEGPEESVVNKLRAIASLAVLTPADVKTVVGKLRSAQRALDALAGSNAAQARQLASLLEAAIKFHDDHQSADCPVCGTQSVLSPLWKAGAQDEITKLREQARSYDSAVASCQAVMHEAAKFISQPPPILAESVGLGLATLPKARTAWEQWGKGRELKSASALADHLEQHIDDFAKAIAALTEEARDQATQKDDAWRPIAAEIAAWLPLARKALKAQASIAQIKEAEKWWKGFIDEMRAARFAPIAKRAAATWKQLRLQSSVDLGAIGLEGTGTKRKVALPVTVDGTPAEAVGVMSQGELHALALSLFLPRATIPQSPFRFIAIDDPVQSMDPARVDGLARVLSEVAKSRQVVVFTHDDRLPEAARRLGIPATVLTVTRRARSSVEIRETRDPVIAYIDDARAIAKTTELPVDVAARVVPGFCRDAIEAACMETIRARRLKRGELYEDVERLLTANTKTHPLMALALFDDARKTGDVLARLNKMGGWAADVFQDCKEGAHEKYTGDLAALVDDAKKLATHVRGLV